jgi:CHAT domain-containing protein
LLELQADIEILHLACHGEFDDIDPLLSRLYFADGPVYGYELLEIGIHPRIVVLSACETGAFTRKPGDEIFGLVRPFLSRGAGGVVATLWKVSDVSTSELMKHFYTQWKSLGGEPAMCLRMAQLKLLESARYSHPYYWAPFFLVGSHSLKRV